MAQKKKDGTYDCALCNKPRKQLDVYTLCVDHMNIWYKLVLADVEFREFNRRIGENLI